MALHLIIILVLSTFRLPLTYCNEPLHSTDSAQKHRQYDNQRTISSHDDDETTNVRQESGDQMSDMSTNLLLPVDDQVPLEGKSQNSYSSLREVGRTLSRSTLSTTSLKSILGDSGMKSESLRVALEGWNFCNRAGPVESWSGGVVPPSLRYADCADVVCQTDKPGGK